MSSELPFVSVIVPTRPGQADIPAVRAAQKLDYPPDRLEIHVARGRQPAVQRNHAVRAARGELLYFLDDDSQADPANLKRALPHFADPAVQMVGGPNLCPPEAPRLEQVFAICLASWLAFGPSRARYDRVGGVRATSEKELILCNQLARRQAILDLGGFDESLYPNEENALMDELQKRGGKLIYDPDLIVFRRPRKSLGSFGRMLGSYGRGRAEQFRSHPDAGSLLNFVPPLFCLYLLMELTVSFAWPNWAGAAAVPLALYTLALAGQTIASIPGKGLANSCLALPLLALTHVLYGLGFWRGLFTTLTPAERKTALPVEIETFPAANSDSATKKPLPPAGTPRRD